MRPCSASLSLLVYLVAIARAVPAESGVPERWQSKSGLSFDLTPGAEGISRRNPFSSAQAWAKKSRFPPGDSSVPTLNNGGFISGRYVRYRLPAQGMANLSERDLIPPTNAGEPVTIVNIKFPAEIKCHDNHAGFSDHCGAGFWTDAAARASTELAPARKNQQWWHCFQDCCAVAEAKDKKNAAQPTIGELVNWARNAYAACDGPNLQTWRSGVQEDYSIRGSHYKMAMCNINSVK